MTQVIDRLVQLIDGAAVLLRSAGDIPWADWLESDARRIRAHDFYGIEHFLSAFGGMGSLGDMSDRELRALLSEARDLANQMLRDHDLARRAD